MAHRINSLIRLVSRYLYGNADTSINSSFLQGAEFILKNGQRKSQRTFAGCS